MFPAAFFAPHFFAAHYWPKAGQTVNPFRVISLTGTFTPTKTLTGTYIPSHTLTGN